MNSAISYHAYSGARICMANCQQHRELHKDCFPQRNAAASLKQNNGSSDILVNPVFRSEMLRPH